MQIILKQLYSDKQENIDSIMQTKFNSAVMQLRQWTQTKSNWQVPVSLTQYT